MIGWVFSDRTTYKRAFYGISSIIATRWFTIKIQWFTLSKYRKNRGICKNRSFGLDCYCYKNSLLIRFHRISLAVPIVSRMKTKSGGTSWKSSFIRVSMLWKTPAVTFQPIINYRLVSAVSSSPSLHINRALNSSHSIAVHFSVNRHNGRSSDFSSLS